MRGVDVASACGPTIMRLARCRRDTHRCAALAVERRAEAVREARWQWQYLVRVVLGATTSAGIIIAPASRIIVHRQYVFLEVKPGGLRQGA